MSNTKTGYKQTEVGLIPFDWEVKELGDILTFGSGRDYKQLQNGEIPVYGTGGVMTYVDEFLYDGESVGIGRKGTIDKPVFLSGKFWTVDTLFYTHQFLNSNPKFIYYKFCLIKWKEYNEASGVPSLNKNTLQKIKVSFPKLTEQTDIATSLSDADALINSIEKLITKKRNIKQGAMQKLLQPAAGWEVKKLGEIIVNFQNGYGFSAIGYVKSGIPIITMAQIGLDGSFNFDEVKVNFWKPEDFLILKNFHIKNGDLIIAMTDVTPEKNLIGRMAIVKTKQTLLLNQRVGLLRLDATKVNSYFLKTLSNMRSWRTYCIGSASLGVQANLGTKDILSGELSLPKIEEQNRIATILSDMDAEISALETKLEKYKKVKLGMMQNLLTGRIRLI